MKYVKFKLTPGQQPPTDGKCLGVAVPGTDWLVWAGDDSDEFPVAAIERADMTAEEVASVQPQEIRIREALAFMNAPSSMRLIFLSIAVVIQGKIRRLKKGEQIPDQTLDELITEAANLIKSKAIT